MSEPVYKNDSEIILKNGMKGHLSIISLHTRKQCVAQLYTEKDMFLTSAPCTQESFESVVTGLMYGYINGWQDCKRIAKELTKKTIEELTIPE